MQDGPRLLGQTRSTTRSGRTFRVLEFGAPIRAPNDFNASPYFHDSNLRALDGTVDVDDDLDFTTIDPPPEPLHLKSTRPRSSTKRKAVDEHNPRNPILSSVPMLPTYNSGQSETTPHKQKSCNVRKKARRNRDFELNGHSAVPKIREHLLTNVTEGIRTTIDSEEFQAAMGAYSAIPTEPVYRKARYTLADVLALGFKKIEWDGTTPTPIVDVLGKVFAFLAGRPVDAPNFDQAVDEASSLMAEATSKTTFDKKFKDTRRGKQPSLHCGISIGMGQLEPMKATGATHSGLLQQLVEHRSFKLLASYGDWAFEAFAPNLYRHHIEKIQAMFDARPHLREKRNFSRSMYPCATFNFGAAESYKHTDPLNVPYSWCGVQSLGPFNPKQGGHLILWECKLVIEFPPGSLILLPSAVITHSNTVIQPGEQRFSFTQYCAGPIFRWIDAGCELDGTVKAQDPEKYCELLRQRAGRWAECIDLLPHINDFKLTTTAH